MTDILLTVSVGCNLWFLFLLLYERIMDTRIVRFLKGIVGLWRSLGGNEAKRIAAHEEAPPEKRRTSSARAVSGWHPPGQPLPYRRKKPPLRKKALSCRRKRLLLTTETRKPYPARHKSRRKNSMKPSRASRLRNWSSGRTNRRTDARTRRGLREAALTR